MVQLICQNEGFVLAGSLIQVFVNFLKKGWYIFWEMLKDFLKNSHVSKDLVKLS